MAILFKKYKVKSIIAKLLLLTSKSYLCFVPIQATSRHSKSQCIQTFDIAL